MVVPDGPFSFVVEDSAGAERLDIWLGRQGLPYSRSQIRRRIDEGEVRVDGAPAKASRKVRPGERIDFVPPPLVSVDDQPEPIPLSVLYEDSQLIVLDKPPNLVVHPATSHQGGTLVNALLHHCGDSLKGVGGERRPGIVHRLDKDTSGVMVAAKDEPTLVALQTQFHEHTLDRRYLALVDGIVAQSGVFRSHYGRNPYDRKKFSSKVFSGKRAVTHWQVVERLQGVSLVEVRLETGRTHQIRVHFHDDGHPLIGDRTYGRPPRDLRVREVADALGRQALHAHRLSFVHPATGETLSFQTPPPLDMQRALDDLRAARTP